MNALRTSTSQLLRTTTQNTLKPHGIACRSLSLRISRISPSNCRSIRSSISVVTAGSSRRYTTHYQPQGQDSSTPDLQKNQQTSFADPERPDLFYHLFYTPSTSTTNHAPTPIFALSFLNETPSRIDSKTIIGWLPAETSTGEEGDAGLNDFQENPGFTDVLHKAVQSALRDGIDEIQKNGAIQTQQGWMHIHDERNVPALGRIGDPDDILASVRVEEGKILADTYQAMPSYRLCTSDGIVQLTEGLFQRLKELLEEENRIEKTQSQSPSSR
ncbi:hypothetical protein C8Q75DRAFT_712104 [Abortiporus biennis]|nr:hypothetical protein C8Q75DRAFT_712104 [Abortiporus biennis]